MKLRSFLAAATLLLLWCAIALFRVSDIAADTGRITLALSIPGATSRAGDWALVRGDYEDVGQADAIAISLLEKSVMNGTSLAWIASRSEFEGRTETASTILDAASRLGWRDAQIQRSLYNEKYDRGDYDAALMHADALLRQNLAYAELFSHFDEEIADPAFRQALLQKLDEGGRWEFEYAIHAARLAKASRVEQLATSLVSSDNWDRTVLTNRMTVILMARQEYDEAPRIAVLGNPGADSIPPYDRMTGASNEGAFGWRLEGGMPNFDGSAFLPNPSGTAKATAILALRPGRYQLTSGSRPIEALTDWQWRLTCLNSTFRIERQNCSVIEIPQQCHAQRLVLRKTAGRSGKSTPLSQIRVIPNSVTDQKIQCELNGN